MQKTVIYSQTNWRENADDEVSIDGRGGNNTAGTDSNDQYVESTLEGTPNAVEEAL